jgi:hypothetical protein
MIAGTGNSDAGSAGMISKPGSLTNYKMALWKPEPP